MQSRTTLWEGKAVDVIEVRPGNMLGGSYKITFGEVATIAWHREWGEWPCGSVVQSRLIVNDNTRNSVRINDTTYTVEITPSSFFDAFTGKAGIDYEIFGQQTTVDIPFDAPKLSRGRGLRGITRDWGA